MTTDRWSKKVFEEGLEDLTMGRGVSKWWEKIGKLVVLYGLDLTKIQGGEWKKHVDKQVRRKAIQDWREEVENKYTMRYFKFKEEPKFEDYLADNWKYRFSIFEVRTGQGPLNWLLQKWETDNDGKCSMCGSEEETEEHLVVRCRRFGSIRNEMLEILFQGLSEEGWNTFQQMGDSDKMAVFTAVHPGVNKDLSAKMVKRLSELVGGLIVQRNVKAERWEREKR